MLRDLIRLALNGAVDRYQFFSVLNRIGFPSVLMGCAEAEGEVFIENVSKVLNAIRGCRRGAAIAA